MGLNNSEEIKEALKFSELTVSCTVNQLMQCKTIAKSLGLNSKDPETLNFIYNILLTENQLISSYINLIKEQEDQQKQENTNNNKENSEEKITLRPKR